MIINSPFKGYGEGEYHYKAKIRAAHIIDRHLETQLKDKPVKYVHTEYERQFPEILIPDLGPRSYTADVLVDITNKLVYRVHTISRLLYRFVIEVDDPKHKMRKDKLKDKVLKESHAVNQVVRIPIHWLIGRRALLEKEVIEFVMNEHGLDIIVKNI